MHDLQYAHQIIDRVKKECGAAGKDGRIAVDVFLSPFSHVTPARLKEVFRVLADNEGYAQAVLRVEALAFCVKCRKCGQIWKIVKPTFACPQCDSAEYDLEKWDEFIINSVTIE